jgi:hypothetical protein
LTFLEPFPPSAVVAAEAGLVTAVEEQWHQLGLDDDSLKDRRTQATWRNRLHDALGVPWKQIVRRVRAGLDTQPHAVIVSPPPGAPASPPLLAALSAALATLVVPQQTGRVLHVLRRHSVDGADTRWHTDGAGWWRQNDFTGLLCVTPAPDGGATELLPWGRLRQALGDELRQRLQETKVPWILDDDSPADIVFVPIITPEGLRYLREHIGSAARLFPQQAHALTGLDRDLRHALQSAAGRLAVRLTQGQILLFDNRRSLHRRGPLPADDPGKRTLVRTRLLEPSWDRAVTHLC